MVANNNSNINNYMGVISGVIEPVEKNGCIKLLYGPNDEFQVRKNIL